MATKKIFVNDVIAKYESGKLLTKSDCHIAINAIYARFLENYAAAAELENVVFYDEYSCKLWDMLLDNAQKVVKKNGRPFSVDEVKQYFGMNFCSAHEAKLAGMESCSSSNLLNRFCQRNKRIPGSICEKCFADALMKMRESMRKPYALNFLLLNYCVLPMEILPLINRQYERIESFGDVASRTQAMNYINLTQAHDINRRCRFGIWSKNPFEYFAVFDEIGKPENVSFGVSSLMINRENKIPKKYIHYVDFLFTVFDSEEAAAAAGFCINCGARHCLSCLTCYNARDNKKPCEFIHVIELLK